MYLGSGFWYRGTSKCTLLPVFGTKKHLPKPPFWKSPFSEHDTFVMIPRWMVQTACCAVAQYLFQQFPRVTKHRVTNSVKPQEIPQTPAEPHRIFGETPQNLWRDPAEPSERPPQSPLTKRQIPRRASRRVVPPRMVTPQNFRTFRVDFTQARHGTTGQQGAALHTNQRVPDYASNWGPAGLESYDVF